MAAVVPPRRRWVIGGAAVVLLGAGALVGWRMLVAAAYAPPAAQPSRPPSVARELAYVQRYWQHRNTAEYGDLGGTDCVNFTSQALYARGWPMTAQWGTSSNGLGRAYTKAWISSTGLMHYLAGRPDLAVAVSDAHRDALAVGDIAQFDWDDSGDRDHTGIVTAIARDPDGRIRVFIAEHSPNALHESVDEAMAEHGRRAVVHYWHLIA